MARTALAVVAGYLAMATTLFVTFTLAYLALGADRSFQPGTYDASLLWNALSVVLGFAAAVLGGYIAVRMAPGTRAAQALAALVLVFSVVNAVFTMRRPEPGPRASAVSNTEAMQKAKQPAALLVATAFLGVVGVLVGAAAAQRRADA